mgnify:CR=1 FL=1
MPVEVKSDNGVTVACERARRGSVTLQAACSLPVSMAWTNDRPPRAPCRASEAKATLTWPRADDAYRNARSNRRDCACHRVKGRPGAEQTRASQLPSESLRSGLA